MGFGEAHSYPSSQNTTDSAVTNTSQMDGSQAPEQVPMDNNEYIPQVINDQDTNMTGQEEQSTQQTTVQPATTSPPPPQEQDSRYNSPSMYQQSNSRPSSSMGGMPPQYQDNRQAQQNKSSVVIKVGMVGDAQIGKTSLMVKYVEGSWDEDYIQTLGKAGSLHAPERNHTSNIYRRKFHGEDNLNPQHRNHILDMGSRRPTRVCQYASPSLQRRRRNPLYV